MFSLLMFVVILSEYREAARAHNALAQQVTITHESTPRPVLPPPTPSLPNESEPEPEPEEDDGEVFIETFTLPEGIELPPIDFELLYEINPNIVAWIQLIGTQINYPVMHGDDNSFYLYHLFDGTPNASGSIFVDAYNEPGFVDQNTVLHGHHMRDGSMFAALVNYSSQAFFDENPWIFLMKPTGNYVIKLFAGFTTDVLGDSWNYKFRSDAEMEAWIARNRERSDFVSNVEVSASDRVVTLSTCSYVFHDARHVVMGRLMPIA